MKGQAKKCNLCGYEYKIGDLITNHLIDNHINAFLNYWFFYAISAKKRDKVLEKMLEFEK